MLHLEKVATIDEDLATGSLADRGVRRKRMGDVTLFRRRLGSLRWLGLGRWCLVCAGCVRSRLERLLSCTGHGTPGAPQAQIDRVRLAAPEGQRAVWRPLVWATSLVCQPVLGRGRSRLLASACSGRWNRVSTTLAGDAALARATVGQRSRIAPRALLESNYMLVGGYSRVSCGWCRRFEMYV